MPAALRMATMIPPRKRVHADPGTCGLVTHAVQRMEAMIGRQTSASATPDMLGLAALVFQVRKA